MGGEASLAPGFRFHPTDEELVGYYLKRKVCGKPFRFNAISEVDLYKSEPWDLPGQSRLKSRDLEWYFFGALDKKYGNGSRTNRATDQGYWKTTGKDRPVQRNNRTVGMKKTLVFHIGRAPRGERTNWVMHEYRLVDVELEKAGISQDAYVLCRIFQKSGSGPRNGEQYGAPLIEEEWDDNLFIPNGEVGDDAPCDVGDELYVQPNDLEQNTDMGVPSENVPVPLNFHYGDSSNHIDESWDFLEDDQQVFIGTGEKDDLPELPNDQKFFDLPESYQIDLPPVKDEYFVELNDLGYPVDGNYHANNPVDEELNYLDASHDLLVDNHTFLEVNDLQNPVEVDSSGFEILDEYLTYFDAIDNNLQYVALNSSEMLESKDPILDQSAYTQEVNRSNGEVFLASLQPLTQGDESASSSKQNSDTTKLESDVQYNEGWDNTLVKRVSYMLGSIPAPPAFAAEFPAKEAAIGQTSATHSPRSIHVTTGVIHISSMTSREIGKNWSLGKGEDVSLLLSCGLTSGVVMAAEQLISNSVGFGPMAGSLMMRSLLYLFFFWVLILSVSFKIGSCICTR